MSQEQPRIEQRTRAVMRAHLRHAGGEGEVCILDASTRGMLAMMPDAPSRGEYVELVIGRQSVVGHVRWKFGKRFGIALRERISVAALIAGDSTSIALAKCAASRKRSGSVFDALRDNLRNLGGMVQLAFLVAALAGGAWLLSQYVGSGLGSLDKARVAMSKSEAQ